MAERAWVAGKMKRYSTIENPREQADSLRFVLYECFSQDIKWLSCFSFYIPRQLCLSLFGLATSLGQNICGKLLKESFSFLLLLFFLLYLRMLEQSILIVIIGCYQMRLFYLKTTIWKRKFNNGLWKIWITMFLSWENNSVCDWFIWCRRASNPSMREERLFGDLYRNGDTKIYAAKLPEVRSCTDVDFL